MRKGYKYLIGILAILALNIPVEPDPIFSYIGAFIGGLAISLLIEINYTNPNKD